MGESGGGRKKNKKKINKNLKLDFGSVKMGNENFFKFPLNVVILHSPRLMYQTLMCTPGG